MEEKDPEAIRMEMLKQDASRDLAIKEAR